MTDKPKPLDKQPCGMDYCGCNDKEDNKYYCEAAIRSALADAEKEAKAEKNRAKTVNEIAKYEMEAYRAGMNVTIQIYRKAFKAVLEEVK